MSKFSNKDLEKMLRFDADPTIQALARELIAVRQHTETLNGGWSYSLENVDMDYPAAARSIALNLAEFCDKDLLYPNMISEAARRAAEMIEKIDGCAATIMALGRANHPDNAKLLKAKPKVTIL